MANLVSFSQPPVVECVMGTHFRRLFRFNTALQGAFWAQFFAAEFPRVDNRPPVEPMSDSGEFEFRWEVSPGVPAPRIWAQSLDGSRTIQIQQNAFFSNWERKGDSVDQHVSYEMRRDRFVEEIKLLESFTKQHEIGELRAESCSMTYVNRFTVEEGESVYNALARCMKGISPQTFSGTFSSDLDGFYHQLVFNFPSHNGRLVVEARSGTDSETGQRVITLKLTALGRPESNTVEKSLEWFDIGHDWIVDAFVSLTTDKMHCEWGLK